MQRMLSLSSTKSQSLDILSSALLPIMLAIYPSLFHYGNNASIVTLSSLARTILLHSAIAFVSYIAFLIFLKGKTKKASNAAFVFLIFYNLYGVIYSYLYNQDVVRVEDYTLLPLFMLIAAYTSWFITKVEPDRFWKGSIFCVGILLIFNLSKIVPAEIEKHKLSDPKNTDLLSIGNLPGQSDFPDIYFILFDEFAGFNSMRNYWNFEGVDDFSHFLISKGFFIAENSQSNSVNTLQQMSERLNYKEYPLGGEYRDIYYEDLANNRVMLYLKSLGYTTVVFDEKRFGYPAIPRMTTDYSFEYDSISVNKGSSNLGSFFDEFGILVADNTMLRAFPVFYNKSIDPMFEKHQEMVHFTAAKIADLEEIPSPKFVHVHLLLPHYPFMFSENGSINDPIYYYNWNYYLGNYKFTIKLAEKMVTDILENADPARPPIIILQSDHGARNTLIAARNGVQLENFPEEYKTDILNAMYLPGYDTSQLPQDLNPMNTFPIIFNHYFHADIPLIK